MQITSSRSPPCSVEYVNGGNVQRFSAAKGSQQRCPTKRRCQTFDKKEEPLKNMYLKPKHNPSDYRKTFTHHFDTLHISVRLSYQNEYATLAHWKWTLEQFSSKSLMSLKFSTRNNYHILNVLRVEMFKLSSSEIIM